MTQDVLTTYDFEENAVRVMMRDGEPWFVAADVCRVLGIVNTSQAVDRLDEDEVTLCQIEGSHRPTNLISESGLYAFVLRSDKPEAKRFRKWVTAEVLPSIRRHGFYMHHAPEPGAAPEGDDTPLREAMHWLSMVRETRMLRGRNAALKLWDASPLPKVDDPAPHERRNPINDFLTECVEATGNPADRVRACDLWAVFQRFVAAGGAAPMSERTFYKWLTAEALVWRCPATGRRITKMKASDQYYTGARLARG